MAIKVAKEAFPEPYSHAKSPHKYTQAQLAACMVLKTMLRCDYRRIVELLEIMPSIRKILGIKSVCHHTTLYYFARNRLTDKKLQAMLAAVIESVGHKKMTLAIDSTGLSVTSASAHFVSRSGRKCKGYVQMTLAATIGSQLVASVQARNGPHGDARCLVPAVKQAQVNGVLIHEVLADAGYDSNWNHRWCRGQGFRAWIPPIVRSASGAIGGLDRARCADRPKRYGKRWHVESVFSAIKRRTGSSLAAHKPTAQKLEAILKAVAYSIHRWPLPKRTYVFNGADSSR